MEIVLFVVLGVLAASILIGVYLGRKAQAESAAITDAGYAAAKPKEEAYEDRVPAHLRNYSNARYGRSAAPLQPSSTTVHQDSGFNPLLAGAIGYMIGSSGSHSHAAASNPNQPAIGSCPAESDSDSGSSSYDSSSSSSSDSSDSGSGSYDSGSSSSDSGGSSGGSD